MSDRTYFYRAENTSSLGPSFIEHELPEGSIVLSPADVEKVRRAIVVPTGGLRPGCKCAVCQALALVDGKADA